VKTYKNLFSQIYPFRNLYWAFQAARKGKRNRAAVAAFEFDLESNLIQLSDELKSQTYQPGSYTNFYIQEPKRRLISQQFSF
jgi:retron-type reverse transcriptase